MASPVVLATFVVQVKGVKFYDCRNSRVNRGERVIVLRRPDNPFDANCLDVRLVRRSLLGHVEASVSARLSPIMRSGEVDVTG